MKKSLLALAVIAASSASVANAADYSDDIYKNDHKWLQFNAMYAINEKPQPAGNDNSHNYLEMEFGGRKGVVDLYGYVDIFDLAEDDSDNNNKKGADKTFMKLAPRFSIDGITGQDLSFGPVQEVYFSTLFNWGGGNGKPFDSTNNSFWGVGADVELPWFGKVGMNLYSLYDINNKDWNGYQFSTNWFKPFHFFDNGSFLSYQGYIDYQFGADDTFKGNSQATHGGAMFNGLYWHSDNYALGYGLKAYNDVYLIEDKGPTDLESSGISHYLSATYKF
ncbi:outer membrane protein OmpK [Salinivibrio sp. HTSP]|uniref:nucleoside-specific channel-forming Tsx family protein n=1 Tax=Salinivibrio sp. HTSP TaxID=2115977 RepID=UPI000E319E47|nr:outer membrane protein OmpK [Salinivibrio sp. HTSP]